MKHMEPAIDKLGELAPCYEYLLDRAGNLISE